jgi:DNA-binding MarR family transcriptional regulator
MPAFAAKADPPFEPCHCAVLREATRHVTKLYDDALAPAGLGLNQFSILARLNRVGPHPIRALARLLVTDRSTLGHLLRPLERRGLVTIDVSETDRRSRIVALTAAGRALLAEARPLWAVAQERFAATYGTAEAEALRQMLERVVQTDFSPDLSRNAPGA